MLLSSQVLGLAGMPLLAGLMSADTAKAANEAATESGKLQGTVHSDHTVRIFKGIPFAAPPVGDLRWKAPQPAPKWTGVRLADKFGSACLQTNVFGDIYFRENQPSEDCLSLVIWAPVKPDTKKLTVLVWFYSGGFVAGANSEPRYDEEKLASKGIIVVEPNYRLGVFGFFSHPELTKESGHNASGNFGLLDQVAALQWVVKNVAAFGGDPRNITIAGESAGSKHAGEIEYVFETLKSQEGMPWTEDDFKVSEAVASYWVDFIKTGNPNAKGLPEWPKSDSTNGYQVMHLSDKGIHAVADSLRARYEFLDAQTIKPKPPTP